MNWQLELERKLEKVKRNEDLWVVIEDGIVDILERGERENEPVRVGKSLTRKIFEILKDSLKDNNWSCCNSCLRFVWTLIQYKSFKYSEIEDKNVKVLMNVYYSIVSVSQKSHVVELEFATLLRNITGFFMSWVDEYYLEVSKLDADDTVENCVNKQTPMFMKDKVMLEKYIYSLFELLTMVEPKRSNCNGALEYLYIGHSFILSSRYAAETYTMIQQISGIQKSNCFLPSELMESCVRRFLSCPDFDLQLILGELIWRVIKKSNYGRSHSQGDSEELGFIEVFRSSWPEGLIQLRYIGIENFDFSFRGLLTPWNKTCNGNGKNIWSLSGILIQMQGLEVKLVTLIDICAFSVVFHSDMDDEEGQSDQSRYCSETSNSEEDLKPFVSTAEIPYWTIQSVVYDDNRSDLQINIVFSEILEIKQSWTGIFATNIESLQSNPNMKSDILKVTLSIDEDQAYQIMGIFKASKVENIQGTKQIETPSRKVSMVDSRVISIKELNRVDQTSAILESVENRYKNLENVKVSIVTSKITPSKSQPFEQQVDIRVRRVSFASSKDCSQPDSERSSHLAIKDAEKESTKLDSKATGEHKNKKSKVDAIITGLINEQKKLTLELESKEKSSRPSGSDFEAGEEQLGDADVSNTILDESRGGSASSPKKAVNEGLALEDERESGKEENVLGGEEVNLEVNQTKGKGSKGKKAPRDSKSRAAKKKSSKNDEQKAKLREDIGPPEVDEGEREPKATDSIAFGDESERDGKKTTIEPECESEEKTREERNGDKKAEDSSSKPAKLKRGKGPKNKLKEGKAEATSVPDLGGEQMANSVKVNDPIGKDHQETKEKKVTFPIQIFDQTNKRASGLKRGRFIKDQVDLKPDAIHVGASYNKVQEVAFGGKGPENDCSNQEQERDRKRREEEERERKEKEKKEEIKRKKEEEKVERKRKEKEKEKSVLLKKDKKMETIRELTPVLRREETSKAQEENLESMITMADETTCPTRLKERKEGDRGDAGGSDQPGQEKKESVSIVPTEIAVVDNEYPILGCLDEMDEIEKKKRKYSSDVRSDKLLSMWMSEIKGGGVDAFMQDSGEERTPKIINVGVKAKKNKTRQKSRSKIKEISENVYRLDEKGGSPEADLDLAESYDLEEAKSVIFSGMDKVLDQIAESKVLDLVNSGDCFDNISCITGTEVLESMVGVKFNRRGFYEHSLKSFNSIGKMSMADSSFSPDTIFDDNMTTVTTYSIFGRMKEKDGEKSKRYSELPAELCISKVKLEENKQLEQALARLEATSRGFYEKCHKRLESYFVSVKGHIEGMWSEKVGLFAKKRRDLSSKVEESRAQIEREYLSLQRKYVSDLQSIGEKIQRERANFESEDSTKSQPGGPEESKLSVGKMVLAGLREEMELEKKKVQQSIKSLSEKKEVERNRYRKSTAKKLDLRQILKKMIINEESE